MIHVLVTVFGESDVVLRLPSLVAMALGAGVTAEIGRRVAGPAAGILASIICSAIPSLVFFAHTAGRTRSPSSSRRSRPCCSSRPWRSPPGGGGWDTRFVWRSPGSSTW
ncbi:glycosyltransferase family 39 protein [Micromonospora sp. NPDC005710]|uniref:glycosyltransferase family 39 protein n=1 Tax=Micromonospora sp. NPDC005710 TaxID=3157051 RepID=UPI0033F3664D